MIDTDGRETDGARRGSSLFDLRFVLAFLFLVYGIVVTVMGIGFTTDADRAKADGWNVNLWSGLAMLAVGLIFAAWAWWRPVATNEGHADAGSGSGPGPDSGSDSGRGDA